MDGSVLTNLEEGNLSERAGTLREHHNAYRITNDEVAFLSSIRLQWSLADLIFLLNNDNPVDAVLAACAMGVLGGRATVFPLVGALKRDEPEVVAAAEDALWRVWFTEAGRDERRRLSEAVELIAEGRRMAAIAALDTILERQPGFVEAYHQRSIARYLNDEHAAALRDAKRAAAINPCHFAAHIQAGHAHAALGQMAAALESYRAALAIHPRHPGVRQSIRKIRSLTGDVPTYSA
jgi:tetratricopeptide (TPR) repeat protein